VRGPVMCRFYHRACGGVTTAARAGAGDVRWLGGPRGGRCRTGRRRPWSTGRAAWRPGGRPRSPAPRTIGTGTGRARARLAGLGGGRPRSRGPTRLARGCAGPQGRFGPLHVAGLARADGLAGRRPWGHAAGPAHVCRVGLAARLASAGPSPELVTLARPVRRYRPFRPAWFAFGHGPRSCPVRTLRRCTTGGPVHHRPPERAPGPFDPSPVPVGLVAAAGFVMVGRAPARAAVRSGRQRERPAVRRHFPRLTNTRSSAGRGGAGLPESERYRHVAPAVTGRAREPGPRPRVVFHEVPAFARLARRVATAPAGDRRGPRGERGRGRALGRRSRRLYGLNP
jgi:hypothetical protein